MSEIFEVLLKRGFKIEAFLAGLFNFAYNKKITFKL
jgi:hypothetical protein